MSIVYVHLSDIHFGQERGGVVVIHDDAKARLIEDIAAMVERLPEKKAAGIIITGDTAYGGKADEYKSAATWLDKVAGAAKCAITDIMVVPGNHDIDRDQISSSAEWQLSEIETKGETALDKFLANDRDREVLYARFTAYIPFAEAYNCSMDCHGGLASKRVVELVPGRSLQFMGLNSALVCKRQDKEGGLLLGARQRVLPIQPGQELVVLCHHPLRWLQDSEDAGRFVRSRARVFISGHEHKPAVRIDGIETGCDLMTLEAGATVPPSAEEPFTYTYNIIEFAWEPVDDRLKVTVHPRAWDDERKRFEGDGVRLGGHEPVHFLGCPNFRRAPLAKLSAPAAVAQTFEPTVVVSDRADLNREDDVVPADYPLVLLRFFRDLSEGQRLEVLVKLGALPAHWSETSSHALERRILDALVVAGRIEELKHAIEEQRKPIQRGGDAA
jgi:predicted MPP superfamily phosphohydrolase